MDWIPHASIKCLWSAAIRKAQGINADGSRVKSVNTQISGQTHEFRADGSIEVRVQWSEGEKTWEPLKNVEDALLSIAAVGDGVCDVRYDDGDFEPGCPHAFIRPPLSGSRASNRRFSGVPTSRTNQNSGCLSLDSSRIFGAIESKSQVRSPNSSVLAYRP